MPKLARDPKRCSFSIVNTLSEDKIDNLVKKYHLSSSNISYRVPSATEHACSPSQKEDLAVYQDALIAGLRLPFPQVFIDIFRHFGLNPSQLTPNSWRILCGFVVVSMLCEVEPSARLFSLLFNLNQDRQSDWYYFGAKSGAAFLGSVPDSIKDWKNKYFFVSNTESWGFNTKWGNPFTPSASKAKENPIDTDWFQRFKEFKKTALDKFFLSDKRLQECGLYLALERNMPPRTLAERMRAISQSDKSKKRGKEILNDEVPSSGNEEIERGPSDNAPSQQLGVEHRRESDAPINYEPVTAPVIASLPPIPVEGPVAKKRKLRKATDRAASVSVPSVQTSLEKIIRDVSGLVQERNITSSPSLQNIPNPDVTSISNPDVAIPDVPITFPHTLPIGSGFDIEIPDQAADFRSGEPACSEGNASSGSGPVIQRRKRVTRMVGPNADNSNAQGTGVKVITHRKDNVLPVNVNAIRDSLRKESQKTHESLKAEHENLRASLSSSEQATTALRLDLNSCKNERDSFADENRKLSETISELNHNASIEDELKKILQSKLKNAEREKDLLSERLRAKEVLLSNAQNEILTAQRSNEAIKEEKTSLQSELNKSWKKNMELEAKLDAAEKRELSDDEIRRVTSEVKKSGDALAAERLDPDIICLEGDRTASVSEKEASDLTVLPPSSSDLKEIPECGKIISDPDPIYRAILNESRLSLENVEGEEKAGHDQKLALQGKDHEASTKGSSAIIEIEDDITNEHRSRFRMEEDLPKMLTLSLPTPIDGRLEVDLENRSSTVRRREDPPEMRKLQNEIQELKAVQEKILRDRAKKSGEALEAKLLAEARRENAARYSNWDFI
ncbi:hypothetical protein J5N97_024730 [Dioscorea zingiberensis]|uniref:Transposase (putative) gypsy type domain-containing protein n=1 Tax=Dioscorea zingiberensis TaxID=325984 RepID=A0A9D5C7T6_9LILI|nr:hypothetical protein J5N97_024730 [Dioscorea zingiberensis]